jgi:hypothetical protein
LWFATSFLGGRGFFLSSFSLFLPLVLPSLGVFSLAGSFRCPFLLFVLSARFMSLGSFYVGLFSVFFFVFFTIFAGAQN